MASKDKQKKRLSLNKLGRDIFARFFGFEQGIDITDDVAVLYRKNVVIKNIVFISNLMYSIILFTLSLGTPSMTNWIITVMTFPITFAVNNMLNKLINLDVRDRTKQQVAMYVSSLYIFFSAVLIYARLYTIPYYETAGYILVFYALVVISLYQITKVLSGSFFGLLSILTFIHLFWTYNLPVLAEGMGFFEFIREFFTSDTFDGIFQDILLRTILFILFYFVVYAIVSMGQYMQDQRKLELIKRRQVQNDYAHIVGDLFSVVFSSSYSLMDRRHASMVQQMAEKLAGYSGLNLEQINRMNQYAMVHLQYQEIKHLLDERNDYDEHSYERLKEKTELGSKIAKRMQLAQKCEDIARAYIEDTTSETFLKDMLVIQPEIEAQVILLSDLYITLRTVKPYKRPMPHKDVLKGFRGELGNFFDYDLKERFLKFNDEFNEMFNSF